MKDKDGWIYIPTNRPNGTLYVGITSDLIRRISEHRAGEMTGFSRDHGLKLLVYFGWHDDIIAAISREKAMKKWRRAWKVQLILKDNPTWDDLYERIL